jgi:uncharacterized protein YkwD
MRRFSLWLTMAIVLIAASAAAVSSSAANAAGTRETSGSTRLVSLPQLESQVLARINEIRRKARLVPLKPSAALGAAAFEQSASMAEHGFFAHESYGGSPFWKRVAAKYASRANSWSVGENLIWRSPELNARTALDLWLRSPEHRDNILSRAWREVGLSAVHADSAPGVYEGREVTILTADFGVRR